MSGEIPKGTGIPHQETDPFTFDVMRRAMPGNSENVRAANDGAEEGAGTDPSNFDVMRHLKDVSAANSGAREGAGIDHFTFNAMHDAIMQHNLPEAITEGGAESGAGTRGESHSSGYGEVSDKGNFERAIDELKDYYANRGNQDGKELVKIVQVTRAEKGPLAARSLLNSLIELRNIGKMGQDELGRIEKVNRELDREIEKKRPHEVRVIKNIRSSTRRKIDKYQKGARRITGKTAEQRRSQSAPYSLDRRTNREASKLRPPQECPTSPSARHLNPLSNEGIRPETLSTQERPDSPEQVAPWMPHIEVSSPRSDEGDPMDID